MKNLKDKLVVILERVVSVGVFYFPFIECTCYFGPKLFLSTENFAVRKFYAEHIVRMGNYYQENQLMIFIFMIWLFIMCAQGRLRFTKFMRFNVIQAVLFNIVCTCCGIAFTFFPKILQNSLFGMAFAQLVYLTTIMLVGYSVLMVTFGRYPRLPLISDAAKLQIQRSIDSSED